MPVRCHATAVAGVARPPRYLRRVVLVRATALDTIDTLDWGRCTHIVPCRVSVRHPATSGPVGQWVSWYNDVQGTMMGRESYKGVG